MRFTKMEGLGNDFVVVETADVSPDEVRHWCDRRRGIGADGVLAVDSAPTMRYWNADGSLAEMCGNGLRCVARFVMDRGWAPAGEWFSVQTPVGPRRVRVDGATVTAEIGEVVIGSSVEIDGMEFRQASIGNPHAVTVVGDPDTVDVRGIGERLNEHPVFPEGVNVEFVSVSDDTVRLRVWERGVGETLACGSGMVVAAAVAAGADEVKVIVPGGEALVRFEGGSGYLTGPATYVFRGELTEARGR